MKIVFMGTPDFAIPTLQSLIKNHDVVAVVTQPDRKKGRGKNIHYTQVKSEALKHNIQVLQPESIKNNEVIEILRSYNADFFVVVAYGQILSKEILHIPKYSCLNVHASLLPYYRGAAPIQWCLINGESETGISIMEMDEGLDTGDVILMEKVNIISDETALTLHDKLSNLGGEIILDAINKIVSGDFNKIIQDNSKSSYASMITKKMGHIDFSNTSENIINLVRGLTPWPGTYGFYNENIRLKILSAQKYSSNKTGGFGEVLEIVGKEGFVVKTGDSSLLIKEVQGASGKKMSSANYMLGNEIEVGKFFS